MSHTVMRYDEWEEEICDNCEHPESVHYDEPEDVFLGGKYKYTASGCMVIKKGSGRRLEGDNPYLRCSCMKFI